jgi:SulP family sulfate permease
MFNNLKKNLRSDLLAGLAVALLAMPQAVAYTILAGVPISCGILAAIFGSALASLFGWNKHLVCGPTNGIALLVQVGISEAVATLHPEISGAAREAMLFQVLLSLTLLVGLLQIGGALLRLGRLTQFVSRSVIVGYFIGISLFLTTHQLFVFFGVPRMSGVHPLFERMIFFVSHITELHWPTFVVGVTSIGLLVALNRLSGPYPREAMMLALVSVTLWATEILIGDMGIGRVKDFGGVSGLSIDFVIPSFDFRLLNELLPIAFAIALLGVIEATSLSRSISTQSGQKLKLNRDIFGLGIANFCSAFIGALPGSGSPSRTVMCYSAGGKSRAAVVFNSLIILLMVALLGGVVGEIPLAALAGLLILTAWTKLVDREQLKLCLRATSTDAFVLITTAFASVFLSLDVAFYVGVFLSVTFYLKNAARPSVLEQRIDPEIEGVSKRSIALVEIRGEFFFGAADLFESSLGRVREDPQVKVMILQLRNAMHLDATACLALSQLHKRLRDNGQILITAGLTPQHRKLFENAGLVDLMGEENLFHIDENRPLKDTEEAISRARVICSRPVRKELQKIDARKEEESLVLT